MNNTTKFTVESHVDHSPQNLYTDEQVLSHTMSSDSLDIGTARRSSSTNNEISTVQSANRTHSMLIAASTAGSSRPWLNNSSVTQKDTQLTDQLDKLLTETTTSTSTAFYDSSGHYQLQHDSSMSNRRGHAEMRDETGRSSASCQRHLHPQHCDDNDDDHDDEVCPHLSCISLRPVHTRLDHC